MMTAATLNVQALLDPAVYPHPVITPVRMLQTHISWVFLTGEVAYKIKKPVDFGFLNYSTLEKRRHYCEEEVRLNRRFAPQVYVGVVPLTGSLENPRIQGDGPDLEYAVQMREFPQASLFDRQLAEGRLRTRQLDRLARSVARFHGDALKITQAQVYGDPEQIQEPARDNFRVLAELESQHREELRQLAFWTEDRFCELSDFMAERKARGFIRELHGDLHTGNIAEWNGEPVPFDSIEFDPDLRCIDTLNDFAFLTSDLLHRRRPDLASFALDAYLEESGDYRGLRLKTYYEVYRLLVRAKVTALRKVQGHPELEGEIGSYLRQALELSTPQPRFLLLTHGFSGCGKTFLTQRLLGEESRLVRLRSDVIRKRLADLSPMDRSGSGLGTGLYGGVQTRETYECLATLADSVLSSGFPVVIDATSLKRWQRDLFREVAEARGVPFRLLSFDVPSEVLRHRLLARDGDASEADLHVLELQMHSHDPLDDEQCLTVAAEPPANAELVRWLRD